MINEYYLDSDINELSLHSKLNQMKKTMLILSILFSINCIGQDTTYYHKSTMWSKKPDLYMSVRTKVNENDTTTFNKYWTKERKRRRKNDRIFTIVTTTIFVGISIWFFGGK